MDKKKQVVEALGDWVIHVTNKKDLATSDEMEALPKIAEAFFKNYSSVDFSPTKRL